MANFVIISKKSDGFKLNITAARYIYQNLNKAEQEEVDNWLEKNNKMDLAQVISILYGTLSQRRRTNERFVKGVKQYLTKNKSYYLKAVKIPENAKFVEIMQIISEDGKIKEEVHFFENKSEGITAGPLDLWFKQISETEEAKFNEVIPEKVAIGIETNTKINLWIKIKRFFKSLKRKLFFRKRNNRFRDKKNNIKTYNKFKGIR